MDNICRICEKTIDSPAHFYKNHKIKEKDYYERFYENKDKLTGELIDFKSVDSYFLTDFASKTNLRKYLETSPKDIGIKYLTEWLLRRKEYKNLIYAPGEFECRSLLFPSIKFINQFYGKDSYKDICNNAGLKLRYDYNLSIDLSNNPEEIWCDSREQKPYCKLELPIKIQTLNFADYCPNPNPDNLFIERKELSDWAGVMSKGYERFKRELKRAKDNNAYIIILIEAKYSDIVSINYLPQTHWIKASSEYLFKKARDLYIKFDNFQMVAGGSRKECIELFNKIIKIKDIKNLDIQFLIDNKQI